MSTPEGKFTELVAAGEFGKARDMLLENSSIKVDCTDSTGMTALQQAAFRGDVDMVRFFLDKGADVNNDEHKNKYTALMFGSLSGNEEVVRILLEAGAKTDRVNSVNRTAAEMAAFVAQYHIVGVINNFVSSKELIKYTKPSELETEPKLKPELLKPFHQLISDPNLNPVHILQQLESQPELLAQNKSLQKVFYSLVIEKMSPHDTHEPISIKLHYLSCVVDEGYKASQTEKGIEGLMKYLCKGRESDGVFINMENFVRSPLRSYPKTESNLFRMTIERLSKIKPGDGPTALQVYSEAINGNRMAPSAGELCDVCSARNPKKCSACKNTYYCSVKCQKLHRPTHKKFCVAAEGKA